MTQSCITPFLYSPLLMVVVGGSAEASGMFAVSKKPSMARSVFVEHISPLTSPRNSGYPCPTCVHTAGASSVFLILTGAKTRDSSRDSSLGFGEMPPR